MSTRTAVVTGASSGIGAVSERALAAQGWNVILGARRIDRFEELAAEIGGLARVLDVTDAASVDDTDWLRMFEMNVMSTLRMTRALLPKFIASGDG